MSLSGADLERLADALRSAFPTYDRLKRMLLFKLGRSVDDYTAASAGMRAAIAAVIEAAVAEDWVNDLVTGALLANTGNKDLQALASAGVFQLDPAVRVLLKNEDADVAAVLPSAGLVRDLVEVQERVEQSMQQLSAPFQDVVPWAVRLLELAGRVCLVDGPTLKGPATGFLVGPDLVLTCHHVLREVIDDPSGATSVTFTFDFRAGADGARGPGTVRRLAGPGPEDWLVASDPATREDGLGLDYALVRLDEPVGDDAVLGSPRRGWIALPPAPVDLEIGAPLVIVQHPANRPLKLAFASDGIETVDVARTRLTHRVNTLGGSSGSPCFSIGFDLLALHRAGGAQPGVSNEAVPIDSIATDLRERAGLAALLDAEAPGGG